MIATIDFETTGLKAGEDEVLQVSIIDENYNVLLNAYCRPNNKDSWEDAQAVHGITPLMVANELPFERYVPTVDVKAGKEEWGAEPGKKYYTLHIHEIRERSGC